MNSDIDSLSTDIVLMPKKNYRKLMKEAMKRLPCLDETPNDLVEMLFTKDEQEWLRKNLRT